MAGKVDVQPNIKILAQAPRNRWIRDHLKMRRDMASARILPKHGRAKVPDGVAITGEIVSAEAGPQFAASAFDAIRGCAGGPQNHATNIEQLDRGITLQ